MEGQINKTCFNPKEFVVERIEDSFLRLRKLKIFLVLSLTFFLLTFLSFVVCLLGLGDTEIVLLALFLCLLLFAIFSIFSVKTLVFIALKLTDVDGVLNKHKCEEVIDFVFYLRSLRNLAAVCSIFWFIFPPLAIIFAFIFRRKMNDVKNIWVARFNPEPTLESTEAEETEK